MDQESGTIILSYLLKNMSLVTTAVSIFFSNDFMIFGCDKVIEKSVSLNHFITSELRRSLVKLKPP